MPISRALGRPLAKTLLFAAIALAGRSISAAAPSDTEAFRFLTQATFGPSPSSLAALKATSYDQWLDDQMALPWTSLRSRVDAAYRTRLASNASATPDRRDIVNAFWRESLTSTAQLRWRVAFALSEIFVFSLGSNTGFSDPIGSADYFDMLARNGFGNYRDLLEAIARHTAMGRYLSHLGNEPADDKTGRVPDENFAREVMQLFSIGLYKLNANGSLRLDASLKPIPTYGPDDIAGLAKVFTGWSWNCSSGRTPECFESRFVNMGDPYAGTRQMVGYTAFHSTDEKRFLGVVIPAQSVADPATSLKVALDTLASHPNVGPFIGRQLIQHLVTSNPSPGYVADVAAVFSDNGKGVRGDLGAVIRAILTHSEARTAGLGKGKLREPVLRLTALARAFPVRSLSGSYLFLSPEEYDRAVGQVPMSAPSVFNFFRPGYMPSNGMLAAANKVAPEMQLVDENSVASYARFMRFAIESGFGNTYKAENRRDMQLDLAALVDLADRPDALVDAVFARLLGDASYPDLRAEILQTVKSIAMPVPDAAGSLWKTSVAKQTRMRMALLMTLTSPEFIVQH